MIKSIGLSFAALCLFTSVVFAEGRLRFPSSPNPEVTPGKVCEQADEIRYPEGIAYCERDVSTELKNEIIKFYDEHYGYSIRQMPREKFKIDHFIPLCMGGSNDKSNLWPQHESVYSKTDPLEPALCNKMAEGKLLQSEAIEIIRRAKLNINEAETIFLDVQAL